MAVSMKLYTGPTLSAPDMRRCERNIGIVFADMRDDDEESCAILSWVRVRGVDRVPLVVPTINRAATPRSHFGVTAEDYYNTPGTPFGVVHTHPKRFLPEPSTDDIMGIPVHVVGAVYSPSDRITVWYTCDGVIGGKNV